MESPILRYVSRIIGTTLAFVTLGTSLQSQGATAPRLSVTTLAGAAGTNEYVDGPRGTARFKVCEMVDVAVGRDGSVYLACPYSVRKITPDGSVSTLAGHAFAFGQVDGPGGSARFERIAGIAVDGANNVYVTDQPAHTIRKISPDGTVATIAGTYLQPGTVDGASGALLNFPTRIAVSREGVVYVTEYLSHAVRRIATDGTVTTFIGSRVEAGALDGSGTAARLTSPMSLTTDPAGNLYIATTGAIRKATPAGLVSTFARINGATAANGLGGPLLQFPAQYPKGVPPSLNAIAAGPDGRIYWWDGPLCVIAPTGEASFLAGSVFYGYKDAVGAEARFGQQIRLAVHDSGAVVAADPYNACMRLGSLVEVPVPVITKQPADQEALNGHPATIAVTAESASPLSYQWYQVYPFNEMISGATEASYTIPSVTLSHTRYLVKVRSGSEEISSREVEVSVGWPPRLGTGGTSSRSTVTGVPVVYSVVTVDAPETLTFQWQMVPNPMSFDWIDLPENAAYSGVKTNQLTVNSPTLAMAGNSFRCVVTNHLGSTYSGSYSLNVVRALGEWRQAYFGTNLDEGDAAGMADPDGDGLPNIMEYALSRNPKQAELDPPWTQLTQDYGNGPCLALSFVSVPDPALTYTVEASENLQDWASIWTSRDLPPPEGGVFLVVDTAAPMTSHHQRFLRLKIGYSP
jgi:hypothetical protein